MIVFDAQNAELVCVFVYARACVCVWFLVPISYGA